MCSLIKSGIKRILQSQIYLISLLPFSFVSIISDLPDPLWCPRNCGRCYSGKGWKLHLNTHVKYECGVSKQFECGLCLNQFSRKINFKNNFFLYLKQFSNKEQWYFRNTRVVFNKYSRNLLDMSSGILQF